MAKYVGKRIVPKHCGYWDAANEYEMESIVYHKASGNSYISRKSVPAGTDISHTDYWALCSDFNMQMDLLEKHFTETEQRIKADNDATETAVKADNDATETAIKKDNANTVSAIKADNDATETAIRQDNANTASIIKEDNANTAAEIKNDNASTAQTILADNAATKKTLELRVSNA